MNGVLLHSITVKPHKIIKGNQGLRKKALSSKISPKYIETKNLFVSETLKSQTKVVCP